MEEGGEVPPRFELGLLDSKSRVLTVTPWNRGETFVDIEVWKVAGNYGIKTIRAIEFTVKMLDIMRTFAFIIQLHTCVKEHRVSVVIRLTLLNCCCKFPRRNQYIF
ncbi:hypothetical protein M514_27821 [Trichuris suis]|uniref:Uncharacterized protein n=1 Tax=Trichuris suis TaxID=68888 RepID=A0A085MS04_9BILA|nr:hypothetical protein M514_27821 [Trichuris suis]